jgi:hypothetical protein
MRKLLLFLPVLVLAGCAFVFTDVNTRDFSNVSVGMTTEAVTKAFGEPVKTSKETAADKEYDIWEYPATKILPQGHPERIGSRNYEVLFVDGKVDQWRKTRVIAQPGYEPVTKAIKAE